MSSAKEVQRQLEEAYMHQRKMKEEYREAIHKLASSSANEKKPGHGTERAVDRAGGSDTTMAGKEECPTMAEEVSQYKVSTNDQAIAAYRPSEKTADSPTMSQDTFGREVDAAIRRNVEQVVKASKGQDQVVVPKEDWGHVVITSNESMMNIPNSVKQQVLPSPAFFTVKRKAMHCEMDDPGFGIAYPKQYPRKNFLQKILGCFHKPSVYSPQRMRTPPPRPSSASMEPPKLTLEAEVAPLRRSLATFIDSAQETTTQNALTHVENTNELGDDVSEKESKETTKSFKDPDDVYDNELDHSADRGEEEEHALDKLQREDSFESLVAETSDGGDTPDHRNQRNVKQKYESNIPAPSVLSKPPTSEAKQSSIAVSELLHPKGKQTKVISYRENYARRKSSVASLGAKSITSSPTKLCKAGHRRGAKDAASMVKQTTNSSAPSSRASSPLKPPRIVPRMTKAALARNEANKKAIESRMREEKAHWENLPAAVKASRAKSVQAANGDGLAPPFAQTNEDNLLWPSHAVSYVEHKVREADESLQSVDILSMMRPDELENREDILSQSIQSYLPKLNRSIEVLKTGEEGKNFTPDKLASIEEAAVNVHSSFSERNNILSLSFSDDPFFQELNKLDHTLTQEDLDKLRDVLMKSTITDDSLQ